ncbi:MAG: hypothetical protein ACOC1F_03595 [Myxococcota bacterium]
MASPAAAQPSKAQPTEAQPTEAQPTEAQPTEASVSDTVQRPFGPGQQVRIQCDEPEGYVFVARGIVDDRPSFPDPFSKVGRIPVQLELPPGVYTMLVEGERIPTASTVFEVRHEPVDIRVDAGSQGLRDLSTLTLALGSAALLAGGVLEVSGTGEGDSDKKHKITIPLFIAGGVTFAGGLTMYFVSDSSIEHTGYLPEGHAARETPVRGLGFAGRF